MFFKGRVKRKKKKERKEKKLCIQRKVRPRGNTNQTGTQREHKIKSPSVSEIMHVVKLPYC